MPRDNNTQLPVLKPKPLATLFALLLCAAGLGCASARNGGAERVEFPAFEPQTIQTRDGETTVGIRQFKRPISLGADVHTLPVSATKAYIAAQQAVANGRYDRFAELHTDPAYGRTMAQRIRSMPDDDRRTMLRKTRREQVVGEVRVGPYDLVGIRQSETGAGAAFVVRSGGETYKLASLQDENEQTLKAMAVASVVTDLILKQNGRLVPLPQADHENN